MNLIAKFIVKALVGAVVGYVANFVTTLVVGYVLDVIKVKKGVREIRKRHAHLNIRSDKKA